MKKGALKNCEQKAIQKAKHYGILNEPTNHEKVEMILDEVIRPNELTNAVTSLCVCVNLINFQD